MKELLKNEILKIDYSNLKELEIFQEEYIKFNICLTKCLQSRDGSYAMDLLLNSERVYADLLLAVEFPEKFSIKFSFMEVKEFDVDMEFRGIVCKNSLNALSQMDIIFSKRLKESTEKIKDLIVDFFNEKVQKKMEKFENYVIDFGVEYEKQQVYVLEIIPFNDLSQNVNFNFLNF